MESRTLVYKNGHFYDIAIDERIDLKDGAEITITALKADIVSFSSAGSLPENILNSEQKELEIQSDKTISKHKKIFARGTFLYFLITRTEGEEDIIHEFEVELLEDLYLYIRSNWKLQEGKLFDCACTVKRNISKTIERFEEVNAKSLNEVYKRTFVHYFGNEGSPACNAIDRFYEKPGKVDLTIRRYRKF